MSTPESPPSERPTNVRWAVFSLACGMSALLYLHRYVFAFLKPILAKEWGLTNSELGRIDSAFALCYGVFQFPLAILADIFGVHLILPILCVTWFAGLGVMCGATSTSGMRLGQAILGAGQSAVYACLNRLGRQWFPQSIQTTMQGAVGILAGRLGALSSSLIFTTLLLGMLALPWRTAVLWLIAAGIAELIAFVFVFRNTPREHPWTNAAEVRLIEGTDSARASAKRPAVTLRQLLGGMSPRSIRNLLFLMVQSTLSTVADNVFSNWIPKFLADVHRLDFKEMGIYSALPLLGGALAGLVGGGLNDYLIAKTGNRRWARVAVAFAGKGLAGVLLLAALLAYRQPEWFCVCLFFVKFFSDWSLTTSWGVVADIGGRATASVFALINAVATLGQVIAPLLFGALADDYGWPAVFVAVSATYFLCALSWFGIDCTIPVVEEQSEV